MTTTIDKQDRLRGFVEQQARLIGFATVGICSAEADQDRRDDLQAFVTASYHGSMDWLAETIDRRSSPQSLWPEARSVIMLGMNYGPESDPLAALEHRSQGAISVYARHRDYHDVIRGKLKTLAAKVVSRAADLGLTMQVKVFVDTAPLMEKPLAQAAGLGWQGKHTNLVSRDLGSWFFLGSIVTDLDLTADDPEIDHCGSCRACLDSCPTDAFPAPYKIDARRCISYLTIENKGPIPVEFRKAMGNRIYGCDDCLAVCPWNKFARTASEAKLAAPPVERSHDLTGFLAMTDQEFRKRFSGSPVKRIGRDRFIRNCLIAAGNSDDPTLTSYVSRLLNDGSGLVRGAAVWALNELAPDQLSAQRAVAQSEADADVKGEWAQALGGDIGEVST